MTPEAEAQLATIAAYAREKGHGHITVVIAKRYRASLTGAQVSIVRGLRAKLLGETAEGKSLLDLDLNDYDKWKAKRP